MNNTTMFTAPNSISEKYDFGDTCSENTFCEGCPLKTIALTEDCCQKYEFKSEELLCNCTQTGEVKILVKKISDFQNEHHKLSAHKKNTRKMDSKTSCIQNDITDDETTSEYNQQLINDKFIKIDDELITENNENIKSSNQFILNHDNCQPKQLNSRHNITDTSYQNERHLRKQTNTNQQQEKYICLHNTENKLKKPCPISKMSNDNAQSELLWPEIVDTDTIDSSIRQIAEVNMENMSDFLVKAREKRHHPRRLSVQEPPAQVQPVEYQQIDEMSDPFASILEQGDHIMDTFHNLLTDNGNLTVRISFSYCAKLLTVLLTLNTIFFSKIIIWDLFLRHFF